MAENISLPVKTSDGLEMYAVVMKSTCPHVPTIAALPEGELMEHDVSKPCKTCGDSTENWMCMTCFEIHCGRFVHGHAVEHYENNKDHSFAISLTDLSCWCYACSEYIENTKMLPLRNVIHHFKFGESLPNIESEPEPSSSTAGSSST